MRIISCHGYSLRLLSSLCVASIFVVMILSSHFCELMRTIYSNSKSSEYSVPLLELQQKLTTTHDHVTPLRSDSTTTTTAFNLNRTVPVRYNLSLSLSLSHCLILLNQKAKTVKIGFDPDVM